MLKRSLSLLVVLMMAGGSADAGVNLFGSIPCHADGCADETCSDNCVSVPTCCGPADRCDTGCGEGCGEQFGSLFCGDGCCLSSLTSLIRKSDHCFDDFISPMTNPLFFEDPRTLTEARLIFANHRLPGTLGGGSAQLYAMQLRAAINEDVSIIATKDGFIVSDTPVIPNDGWADITAGLKINVYKDVCSQSLLSVGTTYEAPFGSPRSLQGNGDGEFHMFASGATRFLDNYHYMSGLGWRLPVDQRAESTSMYWSNHIDRRIGDSKFYVLGECNWYHWLANGGTTPANFEGMDLINLGSTEVKGNNLVTGALGVKYKPSGNTEIGVAYELPLTDRQDIMKDRWTIDWILRY